MDIYVVLWVTIYQYSISIFLTILSSSYPIFPNAWDIKIFLHWVFVYFSGLFPATPLLIHLTELHELPKAAKLSVPFVLAYSL